jgi:hypothetical protein
VKGEPSKAPRGLQVADSERALVLLARARLPAQVRWPDTKRCSAAPTVLEAARMMVPVHKPTSLTRVPALTSRHKTLAPAETLGVSLRILGANRKIPGAVTAAEDHRLALAARVVMVAVDGATFSAISSETNEPCRLH